MSIGGIEKSAEEEIEVGTEKVEAAGKENQETEGGHGPVNRDALLATDHFYDPSLNIIYVIGRIHGTVEIVEGINLAGLNFFFKFKFFLF
jgi:hypothetical protein